MVKTDFQNRIEKEHKKLSGRLPIAELLSTETGMSKVIQSLLNEVEKLENRILILEKDKNVVK